MSGYDTDSVMSTWSLSCTHEAIEKALAEASRVDEGGAHQSVEAQVRERLAAKERSSSSHSGLAETRATSHLLLALPSICKLVASPSDGSHSIGMKS
jgi:hypothetical protein